MGYIYIKYTPANPLVFKIGISKNPERRRQQIEAELAPKMLFPGLPVWTVLSLWLPLRLEFAIERLFKRMFSSARAPMPKHSGVTEWFYCAPVNCFFAVPLYFFMSSAGGETKILALLCAIFLPFPIGAILFVIVCNALLGFIFFMVVFIIISITSNIF